MAEVGWLLVRGGIEGDYLIALDAESMDDAYAAHPGVALYRPREIAVLGQCQPQECQRAVALVKRHCAPIGWGAVIEGVRSVEELAAVAA